MAGDVFSYDVFLSHSSKDKPIVRRLAQRLREDGLKVWFDEWAIPPGGNIPRLIDEGLEQSAVLVLCMSANSLGSDWAAVESQAFRFTDPVNRELRFIPLRLDDTEPRASLRQFAFVDWRGEGTDEAYTRLLDACRRQRELVILQRPVARGRPFALSADGRRAASGSDDGTVRVWNLEGKTAQRSMKTHRDPISALALSKDGRLVASGSSDGTVLVWDLEGYGRPRILAHQGSLAFAVEFSADGSRVAAGFTEGSVRVWDLETDPESSVLEKTAVAIFSFSLSADGRHLALCTPSDVTFVDLDDGGPYGALISRTNSISFGANISCVALSGNGSRVICGFNDGTVRVVDREGRASAHILEGHTGSVFRVALSADGKRAISASDDATLRVWDLEGETPPRILHGPTGVVAAVLRDDGKRAVCVNAEGTVQAWELGDSKQQELTEERIRYTNAKVVLVGDSGSGKTGITVRLAHDLPPSRWPSTSTSGVWSTQWLLKDLPVEPGWDRELWLWDFGGQADQRLIHQLYLDRTAAVLLIFDGDKDSVLPGLHEWQQAIARCVPSASPVLLLAGRTDVGLRFDRGRVEEFARENHYLFFETSAETNRGIPEMRRALLNAIPWGSIEKYESPALFKRLKDEILRIRDEGSITLATLKELESLLAARLPVGFNFSTAELKTVISLLDGPGVVKELNFGSYVLLRPEWINIYAQAVIRTLRAAEAGLGYMPVRSIREGKLIFQPSETDGQSAEEKRLRVEDEQIVLQSMESALLARRLCLQQDGDLVFPSYCGRERSIGPVPPQYFVSYTINGFLDDIYATLVVKLAHCGAFELKELWRDAADFESLTGKKFVGVRLQRREGGGGEILAHHVAGVTVEELVIFANYIHRHLVELSTGEVQRLRHYICPVPTCNEPVRNRELAMERLNEQGERAKILCQRCERSIYLWDELEKRFASEALIKKVEKLAANESASYDKRSQGELLEHEVFARILSAGQKCYKLPESQDEGIDLIVEFTDDNGRGTGRHMYLQLKSGNAHLKKRKRDGAEIFTIAKPRWVEYWTRLDGPVMLVIGTFPDPDGQRVRQDKRAFADVRWMEIGQYLRRESANGVDPVKRIVFDGDRLDAESVLHWKHESLKEQ